MLACGPYWGKIINQPLIDVFLIGSYIGKSKPSNINCYLHELVEELKNLKNRFKIKNKSFKVEVRAFICDTPRAFICGTKGHNSLNGCHMCLQKGSRIGHRTVFSTTAGPQRTNEHFKNRSDRSFTKK